MTWRTWRETLDDYIYSHKANDDIECKFLVFSSSLEQTATQTSNLFAFRYNIHLFNISFTSDQHFPWRDNGNEEENKYECEESQGDRFFIERKQIRPSSGPVEPDAVDPQSQQYLVNQNYQDWGR